MKKNILVTGATGGIGEAIVKLLCQGENNVIVTGRNGEKLRNLTSKFVDKVYGIEADLSKMEDVQKVFDFCKKNELKLDGIVHCAGITMNLPLRANSISYTEEIVKINFESFVEIVRLATGKRYTNDGASIIALSSAASIIGGKGLSLYSATKAAVNIFIKAAAKELSSRRIRINAIAPAMVETPMYYKTMEEIPGIDVAVANNQPLGIIQPEGVAEVVEFLLSEKARYITGSVIVMSAGAAV